MIYCVCDSPKIGNMDISEMRVRERESEISGSMSNSFHSVGQLQYIITMASISDSSSLIQLFLAANSVLV